MVPRSLLTTSVASASPSTSSATMKSGLAQLDGLLERRQELLDAGDLLVGDEDGRVLEDRLHAVGVGHEVGRDVAPVELHALGVFLLEAERLAFLDGDDAVLADLVHDLGDELADLGIGGADGGHGRDLLAVVDRRAFSLSCSTIASTPLSRPRLTIIGLAPAVTFLRPSVTSAWPSTTAVVVPSPATSSVLVATSLSSWAPMFSNGVFELDLAGDGHAVVGDGRRAELLVEHDVAALGAKRHLDRVGELVDAPLEGATRGLVKNQLLCHVVVLPP